MALYAAKLVATAVETARAEERASASAALGEADAAYTMRVHAALERERDDARVRLTSLARTLERDGEAERSAACSTLVACLEELESGLRAQAEAHATNLQQTKQRAAVMLAKKDSALAQARSAKQPERPSRAIASVGVGTSDDGGPSEDAAAASVALLTDALASKGGEGAGLTSRFARRIAHLESALEKLREANRALEHGRSEDDKKRRALRTRLARQEKQAGGADIEYLRNVLIRWFMLPASERGALFPAIAAACAFTAVELASINKAREAQAPSGSWLWRRESTAADFSDGRPPGTPLVAPPPRTPTTSAPTAASDDELGALRDKVAKLRWLLWSANNEIQRLKTGTAADTTTPAAAP